LNAGKLTFSFAAAVVVAPGEVESIGAVVLVPVYAIMKPTKSLLSSVALVKTWSPVVAVATSQKIAY
jgi:hypothetical protein